MSKANDMKTLIMYKEYKMPDNTEIDVVKKDGKKPAPLANWLCWYLIVFCIIVPCALLFLNIPQLISQTNVGKQPFHQQHKKIYCDVGLQLKQTMLSPQWSEHPEMELADNYDDEKDEMLSDETDETSPNRLEQEFEINEQSETIKVAFHFRMHNAPINNTVFHDFSHNISGIENNERCFLFLRLDAFAMSPLEILQSFTARNDVPNIRLMRTLQWKLPPVNATMLDSPTIFKTMCIGKPVYQAHFDEMQTSMTNDRKKRSAGKSMPTEDTLVYFNGGVVNEIEINNLTGLIEYEKKNQY